MYFHCSSSNAPNGKSSILGSTSSFLGLTLRLPRFNFCMSGVTEVFVFSEERESTSDRQSDPWCGVAGMLGVPKTEPTRAPFTDCGVLKSNPFGCK